jgi:hypothetical protein
LQLLAYAQSNAYCCNNSLFAITGKRNNSVPHRKVAQAVITIIIALVKHIL